MIINPTVFASVYGVAFVAELPDKTAIASLVLATRYRASPVLLGAAFALGVQSFVAVAAGQLVSLPPEKPVHIAAGLLFVISACFILRRGAGPEEQAPRSGSCSRSWS